MRCRLLTGVLGAVALAIAIAGGASARPDPGGGTGVGNPAAPLFNIGLTDFLLISGYVVPTTITDFDPANGYPLQTAVPQAGWEPRNDVGAGTIGANNADGTATITAYCIDFFTATHDGLSYTTGTWVQSQVSFVDHIAAILTKYHPNSDLPDTADTPDPHSKAAAVQAAIWFFSDRFVINENSPLYDEVEAIVADVLDEPPPSEPPPPLLTLTGPVDGNTGEALGPYTVTSNAATVTLSATNGSLWADQAMTLPIPNGTSVVPGSAFWLRADTATTATITVTTADLPVLTGQAIVYVPADAANPDPPTAQRMILAEDGLVHSQSTLAIVVAAAPTTTSAASGTTVAPTTTVAQAGPVPQPEPAVLPVTGRSQHGAGLMAGTLVVVGLSVTWLARRPRSRHPS